MVPPQRRRRERLTALKFKFFYRPNHPRRLSFFNKYKNQNAQPAGPYDTQMSPDSASPMLVPMHQLTDFITFYIMRCRAKRLLQRHLVPREKEALEDRVRQSLPALVQILEESRGEDVHRVNKAVIMYVRLHLLNYCHHVENADIFRTGWKERTTAPRI